MTAEGLVKRLQLIDGALEEKSDNCQQRAYAAENREDEDMQTKWEYRRDCFDEARDSLTETIRQLEEELPAI